MLIPTEELILPTDSIPLQLTKLRDTKHEVNEIGTILDKVQQEDKNSDLNQFEKVGLFDDLPMNEPCPETKSICMDIFAEYKSEKLKSKQHAASSNAGSIARNDETNEEKPAALKLIPNQLLIRRTSEQAKPKRMSLDASLSDSTHQTSDLLAIQKKESHATKTDAKEAKSNEKPTDQIVHTKYRAASNSENNKLLDTTEFTVAPKSSVIAVRRSRSPPSEKVSVRSDQSENYEKEYKNDDGKRYKSDRNLSDRNLSDVPSGARSPVRERKKRSPHKKESERRYSHDYNKDKKERRSDDAEKTDRKDSRSTRAEYTDSRRKSSPSGGRRRRSKSPLSSWERQESRSPDHSWSRSRSMSPKRKDESSGSTRDREKRRERYEDERPSRSRADERKKERYGRSPPRSDYNDDKKGYNILFKTTYNDLFLKFIILLIVNIYLHR